MDFDRDYPEPEEAVARLIKYSSDEGEAQLRDALVESNTQASSYKMMLQETVTAIDHVCDDNQEVFPPQMRKDLRECQKHIQLTIQWLDEFTLKTKAAHDKRFK